MIPSLPQLQARRAREHRIDPPAPLRTAAQVARFVVDTGVVMTSGRSSLPTLTEAIVGHTIKGSWMADPEVHRIYDLWTEADKSDVVSAPLVQGKEVLLRAALAPAVAAIAGDPNRRARAVASLKPLDRELYDAVLESGELRVDEWTRTNLLTTSRVRTARARLAALFLVAGEELHTDAGYHTVVLKPTAPKQPKLGFADATRALLLAAVRACLLADAKEVRKWNDWSADALDVLLDDGEVVVVDKFVVCRDL